MFYSECAKASRRARANAKLASGVSGALLFCKRRDGHAPVEADGVAPRSEFGDVELDRLRASVHLSHAHAAPTGVEECVEGQRLLGEYDGEHVRGWTRVCPQGNSARGTCADGLVRA